MPFVTKKNLPGPLLWLQGLVRTEWERGVLGKPLKNRSPVNRAVHTEAPSSGRCTWSNAVVTILRFLIISSLRWCLGREVWWEAQREHKGSVSSLQPGRRGLGSPQETMLRPGTHSDWRQGDGILENANRQEALLSSSLPG